MARHRPGWRVYLLRCRDGSLYAGATNDLARRLVQHAAGKGARYTRSRLPVELAYEERARDRGAALHREAELKRLTRAAKLALAASASGAIARRGGARRSRAARRRPRSRNRAR